MIMRLVTMVLDVTIVTLAANRELELGDEPTHRKLE
jgi:hypothetical protein